MRHRPRRFSARARLVLFLEADGVCELCGRVLESRWDADHRQPYSLDGETTLINGRALCPTCNRSRGNKP